MSNTDVIVVGAGVAGLAAAATLRAAGRTCVVLEASGRIGGRAHTTILGTDPFDLGATWLHDAGRNRLADLARAAGDPLADADTPRNRALMVEGRPADAQQQAAYWRAAAAFTRACQAHAATEPDVSLAEAIDPLRDDPWMNTIETWEATLIAAADPRRFSVRDWADNTLNGSNLWATGGIGALVERRLVPLAGPSIQLGTPVRRISWGGPGVNVTGDFGTLHAASCIVTVSVGVLAAGTIAFDPPLPDTTQAAIAGLPMGLLTKVGLRVAAGQRLGLAPDTSLRRQVRRPLEPTMSFHAWPFGAAHIAGFVGGPAAWDLAHTGPAATEAFARAQLESLLGPQATAAVEEVVVSNWGCDPLHRGAYTYALPGHSGARAALARPLAGGRLAFAGEAVCTDGLAGTVGGAFLSGEAAARNAPFRKR